jgi:hypothetical protein
MSGKFHSKMGEETVPSNKLDDYVVALDVQTGKALAAWKGESYRRYNDNEVHQYRISMAAGSEDAIRRAGQIRAQLEAVR